MGWWKDVSKKILTFELYCFLLELSCLRSNKNRQKLPKPVNQKDTVCATEENQIETVDNSCQTDFQLQSESENESAIVREEIRAVAKYFLLDTWCFFLELSCFLPIHDIFPCFMFFIGHTYFT
jgi:hypothetical protein